MCLPILVAENGSATGDLDITISMGITGAGADVTIIDGGGLDWILDFNNNVTVSISAVTIRNGFASSGTSGSGGGLATFGCLAVIFANVATSNGGGINNIVMAPLLEAM